MATTTLIPNGDGTHAFTVVGGATLAEAIDEDPASHDGDTSYGRGANSVDEVAFVTLSDTPADFNPAGITSIIIDFAGREGGSGINNLGCQVFKADEVTALTDEGVIADPGVSYARLAFAATQQGSPSKADWDGARLRLFQDRNTGTTHVRFTAARVIIEYTPASGDVQKAGTDSGAGSETSALQATAPSADAGGLQEAGALQAQLAVVDSGSGAESHSLQVLVPVSDGGVLVDAQALAAGLVTSDVGVLTDTQALVAAMASTDTGALTEQQVLEALAALMPQPLVKITDVGPKGTIT